MAACILMLIWANGAKAQWPRLAVDGQGGAPLAVTCVGGEAPGTVITSLGYEARFEDTSLAFRTECLESVHDLAGGREYCFALSGPAADQAEVTAVATEVTGGTRLEWAIRYKGEPQGFFGWTTGFRLEYAAPVARVWTQPAVRWVAPTGAFDWEVPGDMPYPDFEAQVRAVGLQERSEFAFVTSWYDPDWIYGGQCDRTRFLRATLPEDSPSETRFSFSVLDASYLAIEELAAIHRGRPVSLGFEEYSPTICAPGETARFILRIGGTGSGVTRARVRWDAHDYYGRRVLERPALEYGLQPGTHHRQDVEVSYDTSGIVFLRLIAEVAGETFESWKTVGFLPWPKEPGPGPTSPFGLAAMIANERTYPDQPDVEQVAALAERLGARWLRGCPLPVRAEASAPEVSGAREWLDALQRHGLLLHLQTSHGVGGPETWQGDLRSALQQYPEAAQYLEFGNELNPHVDPAEQKAAARAYVEQYLRPFSVLVRGVAPGARVMPHGLGGVEGAYLDGLAEAGGWDLVDVLSIHPGSFPRAPEWDHPGEFWSLIPQLRTLKQACAAHGDKPYWVTEVYAPTPAVRSGLDLRTGADYLVRTYMVCLEWGAEVVEWYQLQDGIWHSCIPRPTDVEHNFGLVYADLSPKPAAIAYGVMTRQLAGLRFLGRRDVGEPDLFAYAWGAEGRDELLVMWSYREKHELDGPWAEVAETSRRPGMPWQPRWTQSAPVDLPAAHEVAAWDLMGRPVDVLVVGGRARLSLTGSPLYVRGLADLPPLPPPE